MTHQELQRLQFILKEKNNFVFRIIERQRDLKEEKNKN